MSIAQAGRLWGLPGRARAHRDPLEHHLTFLLHTGEVLASSVDRETTLNNVTNLVIWHRFADWCTIYVLDDDGRLSPAASAHVEAAKVGWASRRPDGHPPQPGVPAAVTRVVRTGEPLLQREISDDLWEAAAWEVEQLRQLREAGPVSAMVVPLQARGTALGAMALVAAAAPGNRFTPVDLSTAVDLGRRTALALDNARLHRQAQDVPVRRLEQDLQQAQQAQQAHALPVLQAVLEASPLPVVVMDPDGRVTEWNPAAERVTGWPCDEVLGRLNPMIPETTDGRNHELLARLHRGESLDGIVVRRQRRDGKLIDLNKWAAPLRDAQGRVRGFVAVYSDVTDQVRFLQVASHELANPFASIKAACSLLKADLTRSADGERLHARVHRLDGEIERFWSLLGEIITAMQMHQGRLPLEPARVDLGDVVRSVVETFPRTDQRVVMMEPDAPAPVWADRVVLTVADQGVGIPRAELSRIFEEFYRVEDRTAGGDTPPSRPPGMGLGLFICRQIILQHGGRIWADSGEGCGSTFYVELPRAADTSFPRSWR